MKITWFIILLSNLLMQLTLNSIPDNSDLQYRLQVDEIRTVVAKIGTGSRIIRYADIGSDTARMIVFIHGSPGSLEAFSTFLKDGDLRSKSRMIAMDRPGYGQSGNGVPVTSLEKQAAAISILLSKNRNLRKPIIIGHSYGGPIAIRMALDYPDLVGAIILVSAAVDPDHEKYFRIAEILNIPLVEKIIPPSLIVANAEKKSHVKELKMLLHRWQEIKCPVVILHGEKDGLVPVENAYFARRKLGNSTTDMVILKDTGHLIPWTRPDAIRDNILSLLAGSYSR